MAWKEDYQRWQAYEGLDSKVREQLDQLSGDDKAIEDHFYKTLEFGTGGIRGEIGPGINRMNVYTMRKAAKGLADYVASKGKEAMNRGVVIAYDNRRMSKEFAVEAAETLGKNGVKAYVFSELRPTPVLSFAVRHLNTFAGAMITASHNPPEYNGFKAYGEDGCQLVPEDADQLIGFVNAVEDELEVETGDQNELLSNGLMQWVLDEVDDAYLHEMKAVIMDQGLIDEMGGELSIVFTPLHGTAQKPMMNTFAMAGFTNVHPVSEQAEPDTEFTTVKSPNPEEHSAFELAIKKGEEVNADLLIATDPDADRIGLAVKNHQGDYQVFSGNQTGGLLLDYLLMKRKEKGNLPDNGMVLKTIVTSELGRVIAEAYGMQSLDVLTGFKFIGEKIRQYETSGEHTFLFGYEESYGYLIEPFARDKDAIQPGLLAAEMAAYYKKLGMSLYDALLDLYKRYGFFYEDLVSYTFKGKEGSEKIVRIMDTFRQSVADGELEDDVVAVEDYKSGKRTDLKSGQESDVNLPSSNVLKMFLADGSWYCLRPSGTEPKIKFYFGVNGDSHEQTSARLEELKSLVTQKAEQI
ncbi:phospho-sugar mutase [Salisediminibacterium selenitireducens]|uniref:Phosphoglucomutase n=1 Tax=Bacillus selenitireducens (strain ATCC 700615 / DSM 15326 / MLS10) TaxID=439292 RepID=D6XXJ9_BACIE|nr:phospho-sugar mutase [Salisediminibacterium selenitireducens]ADI00042.1 phosphoglucomutase/phosphomannomutase alpha/beta/alpha domain I [[Bacillus] selenitireducens MLS10]